MSQGQHHKRGCVNVLKVVYVGARSCALGVCSREAQKWRKHIDAWRNFRSPNIHDSRNKQELGPRLDAAISAFTFRFLCEVLSKYLLEHGVRYNILTYRCAIIYRPIDVQSYVQIMSSCRLK